VFEVAIDDVNLALAMTNHHELVRHSEGGQTIALFLVFEA
jgi:hypothetical protein